MNRREALAALVSLPAVAKISVAPVKPTDVIVVECSEYLSLDQMARIKAELSEVWPGQQIVVLHKTLTLKIVEGQG